MANEPPIRTPQTQTSESHQPGPGQQNKQGGVNANETTRPSPIGSNRDTPAKGVETGDIRPGVSGDGTAEQI